MAEEGKLCVCPQCGKKYRLKEGFEAKSFSCKACGATVWVEGKPPAPAPTARKRPTVRAGRGRRGAGAVAAAAGGRAAKARRGRGRREAPAEEAEGAEDRQGRYHSKPKSSANLIMGIAALALIGGIVVLFVMSGKDKGQPEKNTPVAEQPAGEPETPAVPPANMSQPETPAEQPSVPVNVTPEEPGTTPEQPTESGEEEQPAPPPRELAGTPKRKPGTSRFDPPANLGHLETTPPELRKQIDTEVAILLDPQAGREVHEAKAKLAAIGKPAFPVVLGAMATVRDTLTDNDTMEERLIESSLMLADQCLREMDGWLDAKGKQIIRPGTDKKYVQYILRLHYRRWLEVLKDMPEMPGPYDASKEYTGEVEEEE